MKNIHLFLFVILFFCSKTSAQERIVRYPAHALASIPEFHIDSISLTNEETLLHFHINNIDTLIVWANINKQIIIKDDQGHKYPIISSEGIALSPEQTDIIGKNKASGILHFPKLTSETNSIDLIEHEDSEGFNIYGIDLTTNGKYCEDISLAQLNSTINYANNLLQQQEYGNTLKLIESTLDYVSYFYGIYSPLFANCLYTYANMNLLLGNYGMANDVYEPLTNIIAYIYGKNTVNYISVMNDYAICKYNLGDVKQAMDIILHEILTDDNSFLTEKGNEAILLQIIAQKAIYETKLGWFKASILDYEFAEDIIKYLQKANNQSEEFINSYASSLYSNLAYTYCLMEDTIKALETIDKAKYYQNLSLGKYPSSAIELCIMESVLSGDEEKSINSAKQASYIATTYFGKKSMIYTNTALALAHSFMRTNKTDSIEKYICEAYDAILYILEYNRINIGTKNLQQLWNGIYSFFSNGIPNLCIKNNTPKIRELAYNSMLYSKGYMLRSNSLIKAYAIQNLDEANRNIYQKYLETQNKFANLISTPLAQRAEDEATLIQEIEELERQLRDSKILIPLGRTYSTASAVADKLKNNDIAIEIASIDISPDSIIYVAFSIDGKNKSVEYTPLFYEHEIISRIREYGIFSHEVSNLFWNPLTKHIQDAQNIYLSLSGILNTIPIEHIINSDLANAKIFRLSSTNEITKERKLTNTYKVALFGGLNYDYEGNDFTTTNETIDTVAYSNIINNIQRYGLEFLPNSLAESVEISNLLKKNNIVHKLFTKDKGTEYNFKQLSNEFNIIHLATHGRYLTINSEENNESKTQLPFVKLSYDNVDYLTNEYLLSHAYLVMSGGNRLLKHKNIPNGSEDGILTALEISTLDLSNTDLIVLSACQSGLGESSSEGVLGLQYGLKKAGVKSILMSLDNVDDKATQLLMVEFYKNLLSGKSKHESLRNAQRYLRTTENGKYNDPKYWASFILLDAY